MRRKALNEHQEKELIRLYREGASVKELSKKFFLTTTTICQYLRRNGITTYRRVITDEEIKQIIEMKQAGALVKDIAIILNLRERTVYKYYDLKDENKYDNLDKLLKFYIRGMSVSQLSKFFNLSEYYIIGYLVDYGIYNTKRYNLTDKEKQQIINMKKSGMSTTDIALDLKIRIRTIQRVLQQHNTKK